jgi:hypothetical protein
MRNLEGTDAPPSGQELWEIMNQKKGLHVVIAFVWAISQKLLPPVPLEDIPESTQHN